MSCKIFFSTIIFSLFYLLSQYNYYAQIKCMNINHNFICNYNDYNIDNDFNKWKKQCSWNNFYCEYIDKTENDIIKIFEKRIDNEKNLFCNKYFFNNIKFLIILFTIFFITFYVF